MSKIAIIVPFRNRDSQLKTFIHYFEKFLKDFDYKIFVIEQSDDGLKFNRGILLNIGFKYASEEGYNTFIYHDVDLLPTDSLKDSYTTYDTKNIIHIAYSWSRYNKDLKNKSYFGGITRIPETVLKKIGGFPVLYWGWGGEDDEVYRRIMYLKDHNSLNDSEIIRPISSTDIEDLENLTLEEKLSILKKNNTKCNNKDEINAVYNYYRDKLEFSKLDSFDKLLISGKIGIDNMLYKIIKEESSKNLLHITVDISRPIIFVSKYPALILNDIMIEFPDIYNSIIKNSYISNFSTRQFITGLNLSLPEDKNIAYSINDEFPWFSQNIFHAGSEEQFMKYSKLDEIKDKDKDKDKDKVVNTFKYMFEVLKKGIYICIESGVLKVFLPFSNAKYSNTWSANLKVPRAFKRSTNGIQNREIIDMINNKNIPDICAFALQNDAWNLTKEKCLINKNINEWYANNYFFRNTVYNDLNNNITLGHVDEGDKSIYLILKFFVEMLSSKIVPDSRFFVNPRDMPIIKKDLEHPYPILFPGYSIFIENKRLKNLYKDTDNMIKIYSGATMHDYKDIPMPTDDDIKNTMWTQTIKISIPEWSSRKNVAIFRGSATGRNIDIENKRIQIAYISKLFPEFIDASLTSFNKRMKVINNEGGCDYININSIVDSNKKFIKNTSKTYKISDLKGSFVDMEEQMLYKYSIDIQGHSAAYRLPKLLSLGFVVLKIDSPYKLWFQTVPGFKGVYYDEINDSNIDEIIFVKISVKDKKFINVDELINCIKFLNKNDHYAKKISENAINYHRLHLGKDKMFDYFLSM